ncbi:MAG TPA: hypothetical protein VJL56_02475 [Candidatus Bathyarchaeia archaeon]|nr:hypothetical protein [Candidatus Bathyarchaeia archaeon]
MVKLTLLRLLTILAICMVAVGLVFGLGYDRQGSVELFFSGLALFLVKDILEHKASPYFQEHRRLFRLMVTSFFPGFLVFLVLATIELLFYANLQSSQGELLIIDAVGGGLLTLGMGPYLWWVLKSRK